MALDSHILNAPGSPSTVTKTNFIVVNIPNQIFDNFYEFVPRVLYFEIEAFTKLSRTINIAVYPRERPLDILSN